MNNEQEKAASQLLIEWQNQMQQLFTSPESFAAMSSMHGLLRDIMQQPYMKQWAEENNILNSSLSSSETGDNKEDIASVNILGMIYSAVTKLVDQVTALEERTAEISRNLSTRRFSDSGDSRRSDSRPQGGERRRFSSPQGENRGAPRSSFGGERSDRGDRGDSRNERFGGERSDRGDRGDSRNERFGGERSDRGDRGDSRNERGGGGDRFRKSFNRSRP